MNTFTYRRVGLSWFRRVNDNPDTSLFVTGPKDTSREVYGVHGNCDPRGFEYDSRCSSCFLGFSHSIDSHLEDLKGKVSRVRTKLEV